MKKGIILEIDNRYVTLLTPDGQFLRAHNLTSDYHVGQEISFFPVEEEKRKNILLTRWLHGYKGKAVIITGIATIILIASSLFPVNQRNQVYAYMSIDNESSVELAVNKELKVIEVIPYGKKGEAVLENLNDWKNKDLAVVSKNIINEMETQGFIDQEEIVVSTVYKGERNKKSDNNLQQDISELKAHVKIEDKTLTVVNATTEERSKAKEQGITTGELKQSSKPKKVDESGKNDKKNIQKENKDNQKGLSPGQLKKEQLTVPVEPPVNQIPTEVPKHEDHVNLQTPQLENNPNQSKPDKNNHWQNEKQQSKKEEKENKNNEKENKRNEKNK